MDRSSPDPVRPDPDPDPNLHPTQVRWLDVDTANPKFATLFASHKSMVLKAAQGLEYAR